MNHYAMVVRGDMWRLQMSEELPNIQLPTCATRSTLTGAKYVDYETTMVTLKGAGSPTDLGDIDFSQVQDMWTVQNKKYDRLRDRYRSEVARKEGRPVANTRQIPTGWRPSHGVRLTIEEERWTQMGRAVKSYKRALVNGKFQFRTRASQRTLKTDDSAVLGEREREGERRPE